MSHSDQTELLKANNFANNVAFKANSEQCSKEKLSLAFLGKVVELCLEHFAVR